MGSSLRIRIRAPAWLLARRYHFELAHTLTIEEPGLTIRRDEDRDSSPNHESFGVIDLETIAIHQGDREWTEGTLTLERMQRSVEIRGGHEDAFRFEAAAEVRSILLRRRQTRQLAALAALALRRIERPERKWFPPPGAPPST
jgi:hypothetical protein